MNALFGVSVGWSSPWTKITKKIVACGHKMFIWAVTHDWLSSISVGSVNGPYWRKWLSVTLFRIGYYILEPDPGFRNHSIGLCENLGHTAMACTRQSRLSLLRFRNGGNFRRHRVQFRLRYRCTVLCLNISLSTAVLFCISRELGIHSVSQHILKSCQSCCILKILQVC